MKISQKLLNSINERIYENYSGRLIIPTDIKKRVMKETICFDDCKIILFIQSIYNTDMAFQEKFLNCVEDVA